MVYSRFRLMSDMSFASADSRQGSPMPQNKSMKKRLRQLRKRTLRNRAYRSRMRTAIRAAREAAGSENAATLLSVAQGAIDKAAKVGAIHHRKAARIKSRVMKRLSAAQSSAAAG